MTTMHDRRNLDRASSLRFSLRPVAAICFVLFPLFAVSPAYAITSDSVAVTNKNLPQVPIWGGALAGGLLGGLPGAIGGGLLAHEANEWIESHPNTARKLQKVYAAYTDGDGTFEWHKNWGGPGNVNGKTGGICSEATGFPRKDEPGFVEPDGERDWAYYWHDVASYDAAHTPGDPEVRKALFKAADDKLAAALDQLREKYKDTYDKETLDELEAEAIFFRGAPMGLKHDPETYRDSANDTCGAYARSGNTAGSPTSEKPGTSAPNKPSGSKPGGGGGNSSSGKIKPIPYGDPSIGKPGVPRPK